MFQTALCFLLALSARAQTYETPRSWDAETRATLARQLLAEPEGGTEQAAFERLVLQLQAGDPKAALVTAQRLAGWPRESLHPIGTPVAPLFELLAHTRLAEAQGLAPDAALDRAFEDMLAGQPSLRLCRLGWALVGGDATTFERLLAERWERLRVNPRLSRAEVLSLLRLTQTREAVARLHPGAGQRLAAEEDRRFLVEEDVHIPLPSGGFLCALVARPRTGGKVPAALEFTIYARENLRSQVIRSAAEGYAGVLAFSRGKRHSPGPIEPFEHDGEDAAAVIAWIAQQPWSDGQVGMFGGSYNGFTQWAAAKHRPKALKSIMPSVAVAPGIDVPMEGGVFLPFFYEWPPYTTKGPFLDEVGYGNRDHWEKVKLAWYTSDKSYREMDTFDDAPNPIWRRWLDHPTYDAYWQAMTASGRDFARIDIPVLATSGYFDGCLVSTHHYFESHRAEHPDARHFLVVGPYNHFGGQFQSWAEVEGYTIDPSARLDLEALRYQWLNHTLRGGPRPTLLKDWVNVQVMGADSWRHAPSLEALAHERRTYLLASTPSGGPRLASGRPATSRATDLRVDLTARTPTSSWKADQALQAGLSTPNALAFTSDALAAPLELSGCFEGALDLTLNQRDADLSLQLYERLPDGRHFLLSYLTTRLSHLEDRTRRNLLHPGTPRAFRYHSGRPVARRLEAGSRLVLVVGILKAPGGQVNYGTGKDVSDESVRDAKGPLHLRIGASSTLVLPVRNMPASR